MFCFLCTFLGAVLLLVSSSAAAAAAEEEETVIIIDEGSGAGGEPAKEPPGLKCPLCNDSSFFIKADEVNAFDLRQETDAEDVAEFFLRVASGFTWKSRSGKLAAKADARLDLLLTLDDDGGWAASRQEARLELLTWYAEIVTKPVDIRIGSQYLRFSRCELLAPGDLLAPYDLREPYRGELGLARLPVIAVRTDWKLPGDLLVTAVLVPFFTPPRFDLFGTDQAVLGPNAPAGIDPWIGTVEGLVDPSVSDRVRDALVATELPAKWGPNQSVGLRIEKSSAAVDLGVTYLFTFGPMPELTINPGLETALFLFQNGAAGAAGEILSDLLARGEDFVTTRYRRIHVFALDASFEAGPVILSGEAGWIPEMTFTGIDLVKTVNPFTGGEFDQPVLSNVRAGLLTAALQLQYNYGERFVLSLETAYARMLDPRVAGGDAGAGGKVPPVFFFGDGRQQLTVGLRAELKLLRGRLAWSVTAESMVLDRSLIVASRLSYEAHPHVIPYAGFVLYETFGDRPSPDLSLAASRDRNDEIFVGVKFQ